MPSRRIPVWRTGLAVLALVCATAGTAAGQWLTVKYPGIPRTPDGKPDLNAPARRTPDGKPDLSGLWGRANRDNYESLAGAGPEPPMLPWAAELYKQRNERKGADRPSNFCMPHGVPDITRHRMFKIAQTPTLIVHMFEEFHQFREIHTDGRALPEDPDPAWFGYSVGRWEGDTLVIESAGFKDGSWLDNRGHPHTESLRLTERYRRVNFGRLELVATIDDPKTYSQPWTTPVLAYTLKPDTEMLEHLCENNQFPGASGAPAATAK